MRRSMHIAPLMALVLTLGCDKGPGLVPVSGRLTLDGKPLPLMMVNFTPTGETKGNGALACTDDDGRFTLMDVRGETGVHTGEYKISFYPATSPAKKDDPADVVASPRRGNVPPVFLNANESPLRATIPNSGGFVEISLTKSGEGAMAKFQPKE